MTTEGPTDSDDTPVLGGGERSETPWTGRTDDVDEAPAGGQEPASAEWKAERSEAEASPDGEGEMHRSAVDAVDGLLDEVELALARLDDGTYGRCEECGEAIDDARLAASPIIRTCGGCDPEGGSDADGPADFAGSTAGTDEPVAPANF